MSVKKWGIIGLVLLALGAGVYAILPSTGSSAHGNPLTFSLGSGTNGNPVTGSLAFGGSPSPLSGSFGANLTPDPTSSDNNNNNGSANNNPGSGSNNTPTPPGTNPQDPTSTPGGGGGGVTPTPNSTPLPPNATAGPSPTATPRPTNTPVPTATPTPRPTATPTPRPTATPTPLPTATPTVTPIPTHWSTVSVSLCAVTWAYPCYTISQSCEFYNGSNSPVGPCQHGTYSNRLPTQMPDPVYMAYTQNTGYAYPCWHWQTGSVTGNYLSPSRYGSSGPNPPPSDHGGSSGANSGYWSDDYYAHDPSQGYNPIC